MSSSGTAMIQGLVSALRTFTVLPVPGSEAEKMSEALPWFPVAGLIIAVILLVPAKLFYAASGEWAQGAAFIFVFGSAILTRGLHLDGISDFADGFFGARDKDRVLIIMKDSRVGAFGVVALVLVLLGKWTALTRLFSAESSLLAVAVYVVSRLAMADLAVRLPYARAEGGTGGAFVDGAKGVHLYIAVLVSIVLAAAIGQVAGIVILALGLVSSRLLGAWYMRRVGGVTGDLLGAANEIVETGLLLICATGAGAFGQSP